jgi:hypothetical protein
MVGGNIEECLELGGSPGALCSPGLRARRIDGERDVASHEPFAHRVGERLAQDLVNVQHRFRREATATHSA